MTFRLSGTGRLLDGTLVTQPTSALWFADVGWAVENHGVAAPQIRQ